MNKIIKGKRYDTEKAEMVGKWENTWDRRDLGYYAEELYRKRTGEFFLYFPRGARPDSYERYGCLDGLWAESTGRALRPLTYEQAREWAERQLDADAYESIFGDVCEEAGNVPVTLSIPARLRVDLERRASRLGVSQSCIVAGLLDTKVKELSDDEILKLDARRKAPCISDAGCCYVVTCLQIQMDEGEGRIMSMIDVNAFAEPGEACEYISKRSLDAYTEADSRIKHVYTVSSRWIDRGEALGNDARAPLVLAMALGRKSPYLAQSGLYRASGFGAARCSRQQAKAVLEGMLGNGAVVHPGGDKKKLAVSKRKGYAG